MNTPGIRFTRSTLLAVFLGCSAGALIVEMAMPREAVAQYVDDSYVDNSYVDDSYFYEGLAPHGEWFYQAEFGWVWRPGRVGVGWRPYTEGQWVWADEVGWTWASEEPWAWATYHYGRWYFDPIYGWTWVPGRVWAPAWVNWRIESGYIGWAPLWPVYFDIHPEYRWDRWDYDRDWTHRHSGRDWDRWVFCRDRDFTAPRISRVAVRDRHERDRLYENSRDVTRWDNDRPDQIGRSIDRSMVERVAAHPVRTVQLDSTDKPVREVPSGDHLPVFRPRVQEQSDKTPDRLGIAKAPRDARQADTIRTEKARLDRVPAKQKVLTTDERVKRERGSERGAAPETIERERGRGAMPLDASSRDASGNRGNANRGIDRGVKGNARGGDASDVDARGNARDVRGNAKEERLWPTGQQDETMRGRDPKDVAPHGRDRQQPEATHGRGQRVAPAQEGLAPRGRDANDRDAQTTAPASGRDAVSPRGHGAGATPASRPTRHEDSIERRQPAERTHGNEAQRSEQLRIERSQRQPAQHPQREIQPQRREMPSQHRPEHEYTPRPQSQPRVIHQPEPRMQRQQPQPQPRMQQQPRMQSEPRMQSQPRMQQQPTMQPRNERGPAPGSHGGGSQSHGGYPQQQQPAGAMHGQGHR